MNDDRRIGLRVDVDTLRGTAKGVPALCGLLAERNIRATFYFSVGPDNMGRHLFRLLRPSFACKMLRTKAASLYGWDILIRGTLWPGPIIGRRCRQIIVDTAAAGHEIGLHAWDHHAWQARSRTWGQDQIRADILRGLTVLSEILDTVPVSTASPGWRTTEAVLKAKDDLPLSFHSDCRGTDIFYPIIDDKTLKIPQVPVTLPTYDEVVGRNDIGPDQFNDHILNLLRPGQLNVLTIHAEAEGLSCRPLFHDFLDRAMARGWALSPLGDLAAEAERNGAIVRAAMVQGHLHGREGWLAFQQTLQGTS
ncbi:MAG: 4-deoxy-4-formamido-L-arabinose-phosphoundecaprenol deformylase [Deltaproteobacteria bacterium]|nr:4-deoxy-4-formamido-L-arabinose-phosphoundecaprenol deformylase [Deltaproteobacteria bacterium]